VDTGTASIAFSTNDAPAAHFTIDPGSCGYLRLSQAWRVPSEPSALRITVADGADVANAVFFFEASAYPFVFDAAEIAAEPVTSVCIDPALRGLTVDLALRLGDGGACGASSVSVRAVAAVPDPACP
jgi:hypothetical protein